MEFAKQLSSSSLNEENALSLSSNEKQSARVQSTHFQVYRQLLSEVNISSQTSEFVPNKDVDFNQDCFRPYSFWVVREFNQYQAVTLSVQLGGFALDVKIYNVDRNSPFSSQQTEAEGKFGKVHVFTFFEQKIVIKSIHYLSLSEQGRRAAISKAVREYCISKICEILGCGPKILNPFGFDLIVYNDCIEFSMEQCEQLKRFKELEKRRLFQALVTLHKYKIMHLDINPSNIMFSPFHKKVVFIDFGFSRIIQQQGGFKTLTTFHGTPKYVSPEMMQLLVVTQKQIYVDLYYNDLFCLKKVIHQLGSIKLWKIDENKKIFDLWAKKAELSAKDFIKKETDQTKSLSAFLLLKLKYLTIFQQQKTAIFLNYHKKDLIKHQGRRLLKHFSALLPSAHFYEIVRQHLGELSRQPEYEQFMNIYRFTQQKSKVNSIQSFFVEEQQTNFRSRFQGSELWQFYEDFQTNKSIIIEGLKSKQFYDNFEEKTAFYSLLFEYVRFDKKNLDLSLKAELAEAFIKHEGIPNQHQEKDSLTSIRQTFKYLFGVCLTPPLTDWKTSNRFDFMIQSLLVQADIRQELKILLKLMLSQDWGHWRRFQIYLQVFQAQTLFRLIHKSSYFQLRVGIKQALKQILDSFEELAEKLLTVSSVEEEKLIAAILLEAKLIELGQKELQEPVYFQLNFRIKSEHNRTLAKKLLLMKFILRSYNIQQFSLENYSLLKRLLDKDLQIRNQNFVEQLIFNYVFQFSKLAFVEKKNHMRKLKKTFNCDLIWQRFIFKIKLMQNIGPQQQTKHVQELLTACQKYKEHQHFFKYLFEAALKHTIHLQNSKESEPLKKQVAEYFSIFLAKFYLNANLFNCSEEQKISSSIFYCQTFLKVLVYMINIKNISKQFLSFYDEVVFAGKSKYFELASEGKTRLQFSDRAKLVQFNYTNINFIEKIVKNLNHNNFFYAKRVFQMLVSQPILLNSLPNRTVFIFMAFQGLTTDNILKESKDAEKSLFLQRQKIILIWIWKYLRISNKMEIYFYYNLAGKNNWIMAQTAFALWMKKDKYGNKYIQFIRELAQIVDKYPTSTNGSIFTLLIGQIVTLLLNNNRKFVELFFNYQIMKKEFGDITEKNRYCVICLLYSLNVHCKSQTQSDKNSQAIKKQFKKLIKNVDSLTIFCKQAFLKLFFSCFSIYGELLQRRKKTYFFHKILLKFLHPKIPQHYFYSVFVREQLSYLKLKKKSRKKSKQLLKKKFKIKLANTEEIQIANLF